MPNVPKMHIHFEKCITAQTDCTILSLSWMGKVPDELPEDEGWKLNRNSYYQSGWLATGNVRGIVGVSYTTSHWKRCNAASDVPARSNYNLRGHRSQVTFVQWNEPYQKLASCDSSGIIFVWIKFEGRWSIELINDRSTPVTHFSWSHDGRMALICYQDGFVLVGSVAGQRYWSTGLNLDGTITCGIWTPDDLQVYFGTSNGQIVVMDVHGTMLSQVQLPSDSPIASMSWSCEKFKMEESEEGEPNHYTANGAKRPFLLAICFTTGGIYLMNNYDDISPIYIFTGMHGLHMEWSNSGDFLAVAGSRPIEVVNETGLKVKEYANYLHIYSPAGIRVLNLTVPHTKSPVTALTWGHNDKRIFIATGKIIHVGWVSKRIATLQLLCRLAVYKALSAETCVSHLPIPMPVRTLISSLHTQTIVSILPNFRELGEFVSHPPSGNLRLHCTMIRHEEETNQSPGTVYTLYVEYLGGLVPILKGKRTSKIRPEFVIFDPQASSPLSREGGNFNVAVRVLNNNNNTLNPPGVVAQPPDGNKANPDSFNVYNASASSSSRGNNPGESSSSGGGCSTSTSTSTSSSGIGIRSNTIPGVGVQAGGGGGGAMSNPGYSDSSESDDVELCASPRMQRKRYRNRQRERERMLMREREREWERTRSSVHLMPEPTTPQQLLYNDVLPESVRLVEVTSNIWGTKFKIHGLVNLPENLGCVTYKTSLLHLQPRQMTLLITELRDDIFLSPDRTYSHADEEDEDFSVIVGNDSIHHHQYSGTGNGGSSEVFHGHHVIYHPQGAGSPVVPPNRCFLQPRSSSTRSSTGNSHNLMISSSESCAGSNNIVPISSSNLSTNGTAISRTDFHREGINPTGNLVNNPCEAYSDDEEQDEFMGGTPNPDIAHLREALRQTIQYEYGIPTQLAATKSTSTTTTSVQIATVSKKLDSSSYSPPAIIRRLSNAEGSSPVPPTQPILQNCGDFHHSSKNSTSTNHSRVKSNLVTRAQIENIIDENSETSAQHHHPQSPPPLLQSSLHRTSSSIRGSPTRICWNAAAPVIETSGGGGESSSPLVIQSTSIPIHVRRSISFQEVRSASFLDSIDRQGQLSLDIVSNEGISNSPPKRLVLIKKKDDEQGSAPPTSTSTTTNTKMRLRECGKSKSWDSCDINWWKSSGSNEAGNTTGVSNSNPCPNCSFLTIASTSKNILMEKTITNSSATLPKCRAVPPSTPAKASNNKNAATECSTSSSTTTMPNSSNNANDESGTPPPTRKVMTPQTAAKFFHRGRPRSQSQHSPRHTSSSAEDGIEPVPLPPSSSQSPSPTPTPSTHRRSLSLLTPLLRRRDMNSRLNHQQQAQNDIKASIPPSGGNPASSSFIPPGSPHHQPRSSPSTPASKRKEKKNKPSYLSSASSPFRQLFANSPLLSRRKNKNRGSMQSNNSNGSGGRHIIDSSDEEGASSSGSLLLDEGHNIRNTGGARSSMSTDSPTHSPSSRRTSITSINTPFRDLETFQKQQLRQKLRNKKIHNVENCPFPRRREFVMHNKAPMWNENSQVYQLDFGGRVTQESAKNFQIEFRGKQVMQFGRIDGNAYTLDFQYPFSALQAFSVALANVTQRLK